MRTSCPFSSGRFFFFLSFRKRWGSCFSATRGEDLLAHTAKYVLSMATALELLAPANPSVPNMKKNHWCHSLWHRIVSSSPHSVIESREIRTTPSEPSALPIIRRREPHRILLSSSSFRNDANERIVSRLRLLLADIRCRLRLVNGTTRSYNQQ